jgi:putative transcriptional regulator
MTLDEIKTTPSQRNRAKLDATTEADIRTQTIEDGHNPDEPLNPNALISPRAIRHRLGLSQAEFAANLRIPVATLRNWEQNRVTMDPATISLLRIVAHDPAQAFRALT